MFTTKLSFVVLLDFVNTTIEDINTFGLKIDHDQSDLELGYFTIIGTPQRINEFRQFIHGGNYI